MAFFSKWKFKFFGLIVFGIVFCLNPARATVYNFYFNNTEQGEKSKSDPVVRIAQEENDASRDETQKTVAKTELAKKEKMVLPNFSSRLRFIFGVIGVRQKTHYSSQALSFSCNSYCNYDYTEERDHLGGVLNVGYFFNRYIGVNSFLGLSADQGKMLGGLELEFVPVHLNLFGRESGLKLAGILGGSNATSIYSFNESFSVWPHFGARLTTQFSDVFSATVGARFSIGSDPSNVNSAGIDWRRALIAEAGLTASL